MEGLGRCVNHRGIYLKEHAIARNSRCDSTAHAGELAECKMNTDFVTANGKRVESRLPCSLEEFLLEQKLLPRSVVVEHNGDAVAPSEFSRKQVQPGDRLEIVKIVAGG